MSIKLIATDLDGTFLRDDKSFDAPLFQKVFEKLEQQNIEFAVATGVHQRRIDMIFKHFKAYPINFVTNNGARVIRSDNTVLFEKALPLDVLKDIQILLNHYQPRPDHGLVYATDHTAYMPRSNPKGMNQRYFQYFNEKKYFDDVDEIDQPIFKVTMNWQNHDESLFYHAAHQALGHRVHITETGTGGIDIVPAHVNKASGLKILAQNLSIEPQNIAAFGDGGNDLEMLNFVGHPYLMPNTRHKLNLLQDYQIVHNDNNHSGVLYTINQLITN